MKIAIIGAGSVGGTLGRGWAAAGHEIKFGVRDAAKVEVVKLVKEIGSRAGADGIALAAAFGEVVVLATPWEAAQAAIQSAGNLSGKVLIDCTNPLQPGLAGLSLGHTTSAGEEVSKWATGARVVKAFNTTGAPNMANPRFGGSPAVMFMAGDDLPAKTTVQKLGEDLGFEMVDAGGLAQARLLEPMAMLWIHLAFKQGLGRDFAFGLLRR